MTNKELIALAREHATYDIPEGTSILLKELAYALEFAEVEKHYSQLVAVFADDVEPVIPPLDLKSGCIFPSAPDEGDIIVSSDAPHWIIEDKGFGGMHIECSVCGARWCDLFDKKIPRSYDPCPVCGAIMDIEAEECIEYGYDNCGR